MSGPSIDEELVERIASSYFAPFDVDAPADDPNLERSSKAWSRIERIVRRDPDKGWALIVALADRAPDQDAVDLLGAGPLEDFIREHGLAYLDEIDEAATRSEKFRSALTYTYGWDMVPNEVRERLLHHFPDGDTEGAPLRVTFPNAD
jgi:hypothetical protein